MDKFLCVLGVFDGETQRTLDEYQRAVLAAGFTGRQTMGIPFHVTLGTYSLDRQEELEEKLCGLKMDSVEVFFNHVGLFEGQEVLFLAPDVNRGLLTLKEAFNNEADWTAHTTILIDDKKNVWKAARLLGERFRRFRGRLDRVALYEFFPSKKLTDKSLE